MIFSERAVTAWIQESALSEETKGFNGEEVERVVGVLAAHHNQYSDKDYSNFIAIAVTH